MATGDRGTYRRRPSAVQYGVEWGVVMLDFASPFVPGDMGNASTYDAPALFRAVPGLTVAEILADDDGRFEAAVVEAARWLVAQGSAALTSNCGFMLRYQRAVAAAVPGTPVALSSLLQLPGLVAALPPEASVGIVTASAEVLDTDFVERGFPGVGGRVAVVGLQDAPAFRRTMFDGDDELDADAIRGEVVDAVAALLDERPDVGALLLECAALPPYAAAVQERWPLLPVYDFTTLTAHLALARHRAPFVGRY